MKDSDFFHDDLIDVRRYIQQFRSSSMRREAAVRNEPPRIVPLLTRASQARSNFCDSRADLKSRSENASRLA